MIYPFGFRNVVPKTLNETLSYGERQEYMWKCIEDLDKRVTELEQKVEELQKE